METYVTRTKYVSSWFYDGRNADKIISEVNALEKCNDKLVAVEQKYFAFPALYLLREGETEVNEDKEYRKCYPENHVVVDDVGEISFMPSWELFEIYRPIDEIEWLE